MERISASVGLNGINRSADVLVVQKLLLKVGMHPGKLDGVFGPKTKTAIIGFQSRFMTRPDGRIDPNGLTLSRLNGTPRKVVSGAPPKPAQLGSTIQDWTGDSAQWSQAKKLQSLESGFAAKVSKVIDALAAAGFQPHIIYGWRSVAVQQHLVASGRSKVRFSFHNAQTPQGVPSAWAADIVDKRWLWNEPDCMKFFNALGEAANSEGLVWGGDWAGFRDWAHIQGRQNNELSAVKRESGL